MSRIHTDTYTGTRDINRRAFKERILSMIFYRLFV